MPPIVITNHIEQSPPAHIVDRPLDIRVFKHMLDHAVGDGLPGVMISYNSIDFVCDSRLIEKLSAYVNANPDFVYLAPYTIWAQRSS